MDDEKGVIRKIQFYDDKFFCAFNSCDCTDENVIVVWDFATFKPIGRIKHKEKIDTFCFIDNKLVISSVTNGDVGGTDTELTIHDFAGEIKSPAIEFTFTPNRKRKREGK